jgi:hypothetical protein
MAGRGNLCRRLIGDCLVDDQIKPMIEQFDAKPASTLEAYS